jgi:predicted phage terminase large subunit-like protein
VSAELAPCVVCVAMRAPDTLDEYGVCPFCELPPEQAEANTRRKRVTAVKLAPQAPPAQLTAQASPEAPYTPPQHVVIADPQMELAQRELCRIDLLAFIKRFRPKYDAGWVHADICRRLERFVRDVEAGKEPRMLIMLPPRSGKSEISSRHLPAWVLGQHPEWEIIAASHTSSLTLSFSRYIRDLMRDPAYHAVFEDTRLDPSSQSIENWNTTSGGGYLAAGVGTGITGRGAHILLLDDLVKDIEAADSPTITENTWEWYGSTAYTRLAPGGGVLGVMTWWSEDDWAGRIQQVMKTGEGDKFEIVKYPAINEEGDEYILPDDSIAQFPDLGDPPPSRSILTRPHNTAVHPARYTTEAMLRIKRNLIATGQKRVWQALYQQNPTPDDGLFFTKEMFRTTPHLPQRPHCHVYQAWDFAISEGKESDYTVGATIFQDEHDNLFVADVRRFRSSDSLYIIDMILDYAAEYDADVLGFEDGQIWKTMQAQFDKRCSERKHYPSYEILKPLTDKMVRAHPLRGRMQAGKIWFHTKNAWYSDVHAEMTRFPAGKHDDIVDALAWTVRLTLTRSAPRSAQPKNKIKSWKDSLLPNGRSGSHMAA